MAIMCYCPQLCHHFGGIIGEHWGTAYFAHTYCYLQNKVILYSLYS